jgi:nucleotide-binding universal stress UspA family protein
MKTIIVPIDFSAASANAVRYAADLAKSPEFEIGRIVLLNSYYVSIYEQILPSPELVQVGEQEIREKRAELKQRLETLKQQTIQITGPAVIVEPVCSSLPLLRALLKEIPEKEAGLLILGANTKKNSRESDIGEQVIRIAKVSPVPVLIIPVDKDFSGIRKVLLPCDFKNLANLAPLKTLQDSNLRLKTKLLVLNVDPALRRAEPDEKFREVERSLDNYLKNIAHELYYSDDPDILSGILNFAEDKDVDLIIALPGKHSFFYTMTHKSISQHLSVNGQTPVLILK